MAPGPAFFGFWRLAGAILAHLAVTGGLVLTDGIVEQLVVRALPPSSPPGWAKAWSMG